MVFLIIANFNANFTQLLVQPLDSAGERMPRVFELSVPKIQGHIPISALCVKFSWDM
jgi:hypothetical protein